MASRSLGHKSRSVTSSIRRLPGDHHVPQIRTPSLEPARIDFTGREGRVTLAAIERRKDVTTVGCRSSAGPLTVDCKAGRPEWRTSSPCAGR